MSSFPGLNLEDYVMWQHDLIVDNQTHANPSLRIAEVLGVDTRRVRINAEQFAPILALYEAWREQIEYKLLDFDEDSQSWRDYAGCSFDFVPEEVVDAAYKIRQELAVAQSNQHG